MVCLELLQFADQGVIFGVADLGLVEYVILVFVMAEALAQRLDARGNVGIDRHLGTERRERITRISTFPYRRIGLIFNLFAGGFKNGRNQRLHEAAESLRRQGCQVTLYETTAPGSGGDLAREALRQGADCVLAAGGDGTISEVAGGLAGCDTPLGILPAGTANVLARELGIPCHPVEAAGLLGGWAARRVALGRIDNAGALPRYFLMMAGAGFDADVVYNLDAQLKHRLGRLSYWIGGISKLSRKLDRLHARIDGQEYACSFALVSRVRNYGGDFNIAREVTLSQDDFEVVLLESDNALAYFRYLAGIMTQQLQHDPGVRFLRAREVELWPSSAETVRLQADGEYIGALPATLRVVPAALTLLTPPGY